MRPFSPNEHQDDPNPEHARYIRQISRDHSPKIARAAGALLIGLMSVGVIYHGVPAPDPDPANETMCTDAGHEMVQIGGNDAIQNVVEAVIDTAPNLLATAKRKISGHSGYIGFYHRGTEGVANQLTKDRNYTISPERLAIANPDIFYGNSNKPRKRGAICLDVPGPIVAGFVEADGRTTISDYKKEYALTADEFSELNPDLRRADEYAPIAGTVIKDSAMFNRTYIYTRLEDQFNTLTAHADNPSEAIEQIAQANRYAFANGESFSAGDKAYVPADLIKPSPYMTGYGISMERIIAYFHERKIYSTITNAQ